MRDLITLLCLRLIRFVNVDKDDVVATLIHDTAGLYQSRPCDGWLPPSDWCCWEEKAEAERIILERSPGADVWAAQRSFYAKRWGDAVDAAKERLGSRVA